MAENNVSIREAEEILKIDRQKMLPSATNIRAWPEITTRNNLTFEDQRKRVNDTMEYKEKKEEQCIQRCYSDKNKM